MLSNIPIGEVQPDSFRVGGEERKEWPICKWTYIGENVNAYLVGVGGWGRYDAEGTSEKKETMTIMGGEPETRVKFGGDFLIEKNEPENIERA